MKILTLITILIVCVSPAFSEEKEFIGESESRVVQSLSDLPSQISKAYDRSAEVSKANWSAVSKSQNQILEDLIEALAIIKTRKGDRNVEEHRKQIKTYRDSMADYWRFETKSLIDEGETTWPVLRQDTFLIRHLSVRLLVELRGFKEVSVDSAERIGVLSTALYREVNAALKWLGPAVDKSLGSQTQLPEYLAGEHVAPSDGDKTAN